MRLPPFPPEYRASDLQLHITSLPSRYGIGDLGPAAAAWVDRLHEVGRRIGDLLTHNLPELLSPEVTR